MSKKTVWQKLYIFVFIHNAFLFPAVDVDVNCMDMNVTCSGSAKLLFGLMESLKAVSIAAESQMEKVDDVILQLQNSLQELIEHGQESLDESAQNLSPIIIQQLEGLSLSVQQAKPETLSVKLTSVPCDIGSCPSGDRKLLVAKPGTNIYYKLERGDHGVWFDKNGNLWGYDIRGRLFSIINGNRKVINLCRCHHLIGR